MRVLIIEDSLYKIDGLQSMVAEIGGFACEIARSFQGGMRCLETFQPQLVLLDMTLPTSEKSDGQTDGRTRLYGGRELLVEMEFLEIPSKVIIVTQFDHFGETPNAVDLDTLLEQLRTQFPDRILGGVYYNHVNSLWRDELRALLLKANPKKL